MTEAITKRDDIKSLVSSDRYKSEFAKVLPKCLTAERLVRVALTACTKTPALLKCSQASFMAAMLDCASLGLEPDGRRAHLIPFGTDCQLIVDYKGLVELAMRSGLVKSIHADIVCENDTFIYNKGVIEAHNIDFKKSRGDAYAAYSYVVMKDNTESYCVMGKEEIEEIRDRFSQGYKSAVKRNKKDNPWISRPFEMWKKTVFRNHSKWLPLSSDFREAADKDADMKIIDMPVVEAKDPIEAPMPQLDAGKVPPPTPEPLEDPPKKKRGRKPKATPEPKEPDFNTEPDNSDGSTETEEPPPESALKTPSEDSLTGPAQLRREMEDE